MEDIFQFTMSGLTAGLRVVHIAALQLMTCEANQEVTVVLEDSALSGFDYIPVLSRKRIIGIFERKCATGDGTVRDNMHALDDSLLVAADEPLTSFVSSLKRSPFRLVVKGTEIKGIVTRSDLIKLPVRLVAFTQICHLEMKMTTLIKARCKDDDFWFKQLTSNRQRLLAQRFKHHEKQNLGLRILEFADFCDKAAALGKILALDSSSDQQLKEVEKLRNDIAHAKDYGRTDADLDRFVDRLALSGKWIRNLTRIARKP